MNVFIVVLVFLFMAGWYFLDSPSQRIEEHTIEHAMTMTELSAVAECAATQHMNELRGISVALPCAAQYEIHSSRICLDDRGAVTPCTATGKQKRNITGFVVTATGMLEPEFSDQIMTVLEKNFPHSTGFGLIIQHDKETILLSASGGHRDLPAALVKAANLTDGQIAYITQYEVEDVIATVSAAAAPTVNCDPGYIRVFRSGKWQCLPAGDTKICTGNTIWDPDAGNCVPDTQSKPLCASTQTAVMVGDNWQCMDPLPDIVCGATEVAVLNYSTMTWECAKNPAFANKLSKCDHLPRGTVVYGGVGQRLQVHATRCTECEQMITDPDTCETRCVPDATQLANPSCWPKNATCSGSHRAIYFGFQSASGILDAAKYISQIANSNPSLDGSHSQNRKFNCLDCGTGYIDNAASASPFVAVCQ